MTYSHPLAVPKTKILYKMKKARKRASKTRKDGNKGRRQAGNFNEFYM